ncbi:MaoC family dehydratase N-terminal domain-containing protein [Methylobacterium sp. J-067]|uniref:FAS1-like dehydratase domain-containing protein n=1 Tax=Methylobacterium sp. J-067 TaxID=2836648 RepID=UPI001FB973D6|nr:MaoC family dehydratase N-terminal domain-containing protein [Methylobacterium sp. J-067]MCJ2025920.1 MaoC family dehydratase N-terminal domain-containing protein [Methylobacterium sp. J-067]
MGGDFADWIGRTREGQDLVTPRLMAEFRATFTPHLAPVPAGVAWPALHWCLAPDTPAIDALGPDGHAAKGEFLPPVPLPRRMWAGGEVVTLAPLREGDAVTRVETVRDVAFKEGRSGRLCFVTVDHVVSGPRGPAIRERQDIVYREAAGAPTGAGAEPERGDAADYAQCCTLPATPTLLFRYSAMTFNGHRFHYDHPYATQVEGYADLVVHGPIQATLLMNLATAMLGRVPARFRHRGVSPMTANQDFCVCGRLTPDGWEGVTLDADDRVCMRASAGA